MSTPFYKLIRPGKLNCLPNRLDGVETRRQMVDERDLRVRILSKCTSRDSMKLAEKLDSCRHRNPCESPACPMCAHQLRAWSFGEVSHLSRQYDPVLMMTILCYSMMLTDKQLFCYDFKKLMRLLGRRFERCGFTCPVIGYVEFDFHPESNLWLPHFHLMVLGAEPAIDMFRKRYAPIEKRQKSGATVDRFLHVVPLRNKARQLSYLCKAFCSRVEAYTDKNGKRRTKKYRLSASQHRLSLRVFDRLGMSGRLFLYRARRVGSEIRVTR